MFTARVLHEQSPGEANNTRVEATPDACLSFIRGPLDLWGALGCMLSIHPWPSRSAWTGRTEAGPKKTAKVELRGCE